MDKTGKPTLAPAQNLIDNHAHPGHRRRTESTVGDQDKP